MADGSRGPRKRAIGRPGLAIVNIDRIDDGVARVARLLHRAVRDASGEEPYLAPLAPASRSRVTGFERARFASKLFRIQLAGRVDWLLFNHIGLAKAQCLIPAACRRPFGVVLYGIDAWVERFPRLEERALREAALRLAISEHTAARTEELHPRIGPVVACPLALDVAEGVVGRADRSLLTRLGSDAVLIVARMAASERYKGHDELLTAWPTVLDHVPSAQLVVVGRGDDFGRLRRKAIDLGLGDSVLFTGFVSDATLSELRRRVKLFAMPSRGEGFGLVYLEAMRVGLPCIASTADGGAEVVLHEQTGLLVDPNDRAALADAIVRLLLDENLRRAYGEAGRRRYEREFTYEAFQRRLVPILVQAFGE